MSDAIQKTACHVFVEQIGTLCLFLTRCQLKSAHKESWIMSNKIILFDTLILIKQSNHFDYANQKHNTVIVESFKSF